MSIYYKDECREEVINVRQSVKQFKQLLQTFFGLAPANMRLWYYDQELSKLVGPEEMKWGTKEVYTYNEVTGQVELMVSGLGGEDGGRHSPTSQPTTPHHSRAKTRSKSSGRRKKLEKAFSTGRDSLSVTSRNYHFLH